jgi:hypothetical protein
MEITGLRPLTGQVHRATRGAEGMPRRDHASAWLEPVTGGYRGRRTLQQQYRGHVVRAVPLGARRRRGDRGHDVMYYPGNATMYLTSLDGRGLAREPSVESRRRHRTRRRAVAGRVCAVCARHRKFNRPFRLVCEVAGGGARCREDGGWASLPSFSPGLGGFIAPFRAVCRRRAERGPAGCCPH